MNKQTEIIEKFGRLFELEGLPRIAGRMTGFLLLHEGACSLDDLADRLRISKTSASTNARLLERLGLLDQVTRPGDRRDYYALAEDPGGRMFSMVKRRIQNFHDLLSEAVDAVPQSCRVGRARVRNMQAFYEFLLDDIDERLSSWQANRHKKTS